MQARARPRKHVHVVPEGGHSRVTWSGREAALRGPTSWTSQGGRRATGGAEPVGAAPLLQRASPARPPAPWPPARPPGTGACAAGRRAGPTSGPRGPGRPRRWCAGAWCARPPPAGASTPFRDEQAGGGGRHSSPLAWRGGGSGWRAVITLFSRLACPDRGRASAGWPARGRAGRGRQGRAAEGQKRWAAKGREAR